MEDREPSLAGAERRYRFPKREKLKRREEIKAVFNQRYDRLSSRRHSVSVDGAKLITKKNGLAYNRITFTFPGKFGSAVERNRSRRISREAYRHLRRSIKPGWDIVLLVYPDRAADALDRSDSGSCPTGGKSRHHGFASRCAQLKELLIRARLFENEAVKLNRV